MSREVDLHQVADTVHPLLAAMASKEATDQPHSNSMASKATLNKAMVSKVATVLKQATDSLLPSNLTASLHRNKAMGSNHSRATASQELTVSSHSKATDSKGTVNKVLLDSRGMASKVSRGSISMAMDNSHRNMEAIARSLVMADLLNRADIHLSREDMEVRHRLGIRIPRHYWVKARARIKRLVVGSFSKRLTLGGSIQTCG